MDLNKENYKRFDILNDSSHILPDKPGNYIVVLRQGSTLPGKQQPEMLTTVSYDGEEFQVIYTGISTNLRKRDYRQHFTGNNAGKSTLRKSLGSLMELKKIPRDKTPSLSGSEKTKFTDEDEATLSKWMKENLLFFFNENNMPEMEEGRLIFTLNPPLNLKNNSNPINEAFRKGLSKLRNNKDRK